MQAEPTKFGKTWPGRSPQDVVRTTSGRTMKRLYSGDVTGGGRGPTPFPPLELMEDPAPADWVVERLRSWRGGALRVGAVVPDGYPAYARLLHPAYRDDREGPVRWAEIAAERGLELGAETRFNDVVGWVPARDGEDPPEPYGAPHRGSLTKDQCALVAEVLAGFTASPELCWFCLWEGYGWPELDQFRGWPPRVKVPHRDCILFRGPVSAATAFRSPPWSQSPTLWWPDDRAWCVASDLDFYSTYIAGSVQAVQALLSQPALEALATKAEHRVDPSPFPPRD